MFVNGDDVSHEIRHQEVTSAVSGVSAMPEVRRVLVEHQRRWVAEHGGSAVVEGRDIGTVVFPDAPVKVFLTARPEIRAERRAIEHDVADVSAVAQDLARRDTYDSSRAASPLTAADDAVVLDTSDLTIEQVVERIVRMVRRKRDS
jgi:cytidylate kinase